MERLETYFDYDRFSNSTYGSDLNLLREMSKQHGLKFTIYRHYGTCEVNNKHINLNNVIIVSGSLHAVIAFRLKWSQPFLQHPFYGSGTKMLSIEAGKILWPGPLTNT